MQFISVMRSYARTNRRHNLQIATFSFRDTPRWERRQYNGWLNISINNSTNHAMRHHAMNRSRGVVVFNNGKSIARLGCRDRYPTNGHRIQPSRETSNCTITRTPTDGFTQNAESFRSRRFVFSASAVTAYVHRNSKREFTVFIRRAPRNPALGPISRSPFNRPLGDYSVVGFGSSKQTGCATGRAVTGTHRRAVFIGIMSSSQLMAHGSLSKTCKFQLDKKDVGNQGGRCTFTPSVSGSCFKTMSLFCKRLVFFGAVAMTLVALWSSSQTRHRQESMLLATRYHARNRTARFFEHSATRKASPHPAHRPAMPLHPSR